MIYDEQDRPRFWTVLSLNSISFGGVCSTVDGQSVVPEHEVFETTALTPELLVSVGAMDEPSPLALWSIGWNSGRAAGPPQPSFDLLMGLGPSSVNPLDMCRQHFQFASPGWAAGVHVQVIWPLGDTDADEPAFESLADVEAFTTTDDYATLRAILLSMNFDPGS